MKWDGVAMLESFSAITFLMKNGGEDWHLKDCALTVDQLEDILDLDFFCGLLPQDSALHRKHRGLGRLDAEITTLLYIRKINISLNKIY